uniref:Uncharacterized protein n=1 Tax=Moschus moschiferus TaxID=68415 RepID=A0A8C6FG95_MOSMO
MAAAALRDLSQIVGVQQRGMRYLLSRAFL